MNLKFKKFFEKSNKYDKYDELLSGIMCDPDPDENIEMDLRNSRLLMKELIEDDIPAKSKKAIIQKWTDKAFRYFNNTRFEFYPLIFFTLLFEDGKELKAYKDVRYDYIEYLADYVYRFKPDIKDRFINDKIQANGLETIYEEFKRKLIKCQNMRKRKYRTALLYILTSMMVFLLGTLFGTAICQNNTTNIKDSSVVENYVSEKSKISGDTNKQTSDRKQSQKDNDISDSTKSSLPDESSTDDTSDTSESTDISDNENSTPSDENSTDDTSDISEPTDISDDEDSTPSDESSTDDDTSDISELTDMSDNENSMDEEFSSENEDIYESQDEYT